MGGRLAAISPRCTGGPWLDGVANPRGGREQPIEAAGRAAEEEESGPSRRRSELMKCFPKIHAGWHRPGAAPHAGKKTSFAKAKPSISVFEAHRKKPLIRLHRPHAPRRSCLLAFLRRGRKNTGVSDQFAFSRPSTASTGQNNPIMAVKV